MKVTQTMFVGMPMMVLQEVSATGKVVSVSASKLLVNQSLEVGARTKCIIGITPKKTGTTHTEKELRVGE